MATPSRHEGGLHVDGNLTMKTIGLPAGGVVNTHVSENAGLDATKLKHQYEITQAQGSGDNVAAETQVRHLVYGTTGEVIAFEGGSIVAGLGTYEVTIDLLKNGTTVLTTPVVLTTNETAMEVVSSVIGTTPLVANDVLEVDISITGTTGTAAQGVFSRLVVREDPA